MSDLSASSSIYGPSPAAQYATRRIAEFASTARLKAFPEAVWHEATRCFVNFVGCALGGSQHESVERAQKALAEFSGPPTATIIGRSEMRDVLAAALLNAMSASAHNFDDTHAESIVHPTAPVAAALLAVAERDRVRGEEFLTALAIGIEVVCRMSKAFSEPPAHSHPGWVQTGTAGVIGAAVAAGRCLNLSFPQLRAAIGIAASQASGIGGALGSMCTSLIPAHAAQCGLRAALLAQSGFSGSDVILESRHGFADVFCQDPNFEALTEKLGQSFEILANTYKAYPCSVVLQPVVDGLLRIRASDDIDPKEIDCVLVTVSPLTLDLAGRRAPRDGIDAQFSIYHWAAATLLFGKAGIAEGSDRAVLDPEVIELRGKVATLADSSIDRHSAKLTVVLRNGRTFQADVVHCKGSREEPLTDKDLTQKFTEQASELLTESQVSRLLSLCWKVGTIDDVGEVARNSAARAAVAVAAVT